MNLVEQLRQESLKHIFSVGSFRKDWPARLRHIQPMFDQAKNRQDIVDIGNRLSEIFACVGASNRSQGGVSSGGAVWECLLVWYLNLCLEGTSAYCIKGAKLAPPIVKNAFTVKHENTILRSEPDVLLISTEKLLTEPASKSLTDAHEKLNVIIDRHFSDVGLINFQCKTNWNDNAQIPMLWNMLYSQSRKGALIENGFTIGTDGSSIQNLGHFGYAFVTVPTQKDRHNKFKPTNLTVLRAKTMSAGNYWGHPSINGVCQSISKVFDIFSRNPSVYPNVANIGKNIADTIPLDNSFDISRCRYLTE